MREPLGSGRHAPPRSTLRTSSPAERYHRPRGTKALPDGVIWAGRGSLWANPFFNRRWGHAKSVTLHGRWLRGEIAALSIERMGFDLGEVDALLRLRARVLTNLWRLEGHDLACSCPLASRWCHVNNLLPLIPLHVDYERLAA